MPENTGFVALLLKGGWTMLPLIFCSILSLGIVAERVWFFSKKRTDVRGTLEEIRAASKRKDWSEALAICNETGGSAAQVLKAGLSKRGKGPKAIKDAMDLKAREETSDLERYIPVVGTIGNIAPFIGLFGTVLGVMRAFKDIAAAGGGGSAVVMNGIAEALITTATGLFVAVPAVIGFNYLVNTVQKFSSEFENASDELLDLMDEKEA